MPQARKPSRAPRLTAAQKAAARAEHAARRDIAGVLFRAAELRSSAWWTSGLRRSQRERLLAEADSLVRTLTRTASNDEALVLTVAQDALLTAGSDLADVESFDVIAGYQKRLDTMRRHSGTLLVMAVDDADEAWPDDILIRGVETPEEVAAATAMRRWWDRTHPRSTPASAQLRREFLQATVDVLAAWIDSSISEETDDELVEALLAPEGWYRDVLDGGSYPGF
jgi:hypothetical protein